MHHFGLVGLALLLSTFFLPALALAQDPCVALEERICSLCGQGSAACNAFTHISDSPQSCQEGLDTIDTIFDAKIDSSSQREDMTQIFCTAVVDATREDRGALQSLASRASTGSCDDLHVSVCTLCGDATAACRTARQSQDPTHCARVLGNITLLAGTLETLDNDARDRLVGRFCDTLGAAAAPLRERQLLALQDRCKTLETTAASAAPEACDALASTLAQHIDAARTLIRSLDSLEPLTPTESQRILSRCVSGLNTVRSGACASHPSVQSTLENLELQGAP